jgi:hypothetical protein
MASRLPRKKIQYKDFSKNKELRKVGPDVMGFFDASTEEIFVNKKNLTEILYRKKLVEKHELVHYRRFLDNNKQWLPNYLEENETALEAIARTPKGDLSGVEAIIHDYLIGDRYRRLDPNNPKDLRKIMRKIRRITDPYYFNRIRYFSNEIRKKMNKIIKNIYVFFIKK